jgi:hypothetical protein
MNEEYINLPKTVNTDVLTNIFVLNKNSFNKYSSEFTVVSIKTIKESCKFLINLLDKDTSTYKKDLKKIEDMEVILINSITQSKKDFKDKRELKKK